MNGLIVLAACVCASTAQFAPGLAIPAAAPSHQFHAQDELGQFSFGHAGGPSARTEARNAYGVTTGSYQYVDANGLIQTVNYIADDVHGFRVQGTNLPVGPGAGPVGPIFEGVQAPAPVFAGVQIADTPEVIEAKAAFAAAYAAQEAAVAAVVVERKKRDADEVAVAAAPAVVAHPTLLSAGLPYPYATGLHGAYAGAYGLAGAYAHPGAYGLAGAYGLPAAYAGLPAAAPADIVATIAHPVPAAVAPVVAAPALAYAGAIAAPIAAAPSRDAVLTTIKLNPGHAVFYRVD